MNTSDILNPLTIPLIGRHMIEASAGTGKTHNITRIYVRLLVEKKLSVQQILVMTFTEAATEEIKARIATFIDTLINDFESNPCECSSALQVTVGADETLRLLKIAQLEIDLASIYTINGFCQRIIGRFGLSMSLPQNADLVVDFYKIQLAYVSDAIRALRTKPDKYLLLQNENLHDPSVFMKNFSKVIGKTETLTVQSEQELKTKQVLQFNKLWQKHGALRAQLIADINAQRTFFYQGTKSSTPKNTDPLIDEVLGWLGSTMLINNKQSVAFINAWLGIEGATKDAVKEADQTLINNAFKNLFSAARIKNYVNEGMQTTQPLLANANALLEDIKRVGVLAADKKSLKDSINAVPFYAVIYALVSKINKKIEQHKQTFSVIGFDDQIQGVAHAMNCGGEALIESLQQEYPAALVDEFQDTDKHQYAILEHLYPQHNDARLLLMIGDPKQAIYSFRGGDIHTYMRAKDMADKAWGMDINYRSSEPVITSYNRIFHGAPLQKDAVSLFDENISYPIISAPFKALPGKRSLIDNDPTQASAAFTFVCANASRMLSPSSKRNIKVDTSKDIQIDEIMHWCANEIKRLLSDVQIEQGGQARLVKSEDIAILVRSHKQVAMVKKVLSAQGLASVFLGERSPLFESQQALHVLWLLQAIHHPSRDNMRRALTTGLVLFDISRTSTAQDLLLLDNHPKWEQAFNSISHYALLWQQKGVHALLQTLIQQSSLPTLEAQRQLTNYLHISELLAKASVKASSPLQLIYWLHQQITNPEQMEANELRLESDQKLIKIVTQHKSKGLEYPIVFLPYANYVNTRMSKHTAQYYLNNNSVNELGLSNAAKEAVTSESLAEDMRVLYVSLTRPILRCYLGVFSSISCNSSALSRALNIPIDKDSEDEDSGGTMLNNIKQNLSDISDNIFVGMADKLLPIRNDMPAEDLPRTSLLSFTQHINRSWHVTSFSKILRKLDSYASQDNYLPKAKPPSLGLANANESPDLVFERDEEGYYEAGFSGAHHNDVQSAYCFTFPKGANAGTFLHDVLETIDFKNPNISTALSSLNTYALDQHAIDQAQLSQWFDTVLTTPLLSNLACNNVCLQDLSSAETLKEAEFYFPIEGLNLGAMSQLINTYRQQICAQYNLTNCPLLSLTSDMVEGAMHGYIDLIFEHEGQYYVADYKSNYLGNDAQYYQPSAVAQDLLLHNYDVQYLIYSVALHRYLKTFLGQYRYEEHFGGVTYLYLRGMRGPLSLPLKTSERTSANGIFFTRIEQGMLQALDDLFETKNTSMHHRIASNKESAL